MNIKDIITDAGTQTRTGINEDTVQAYHDAMIEGAKFPPVDVFHDGTDYYLADGFHRVMAANRVGYTEIDATIHKGTQLDALWFAMGANKGHGLRMTKGDIRKAVEVALKAFPDKTQQAVADQVGCGRTYVQRIKEDVVTSDNVTFPTTRTDSLGRVQPTSKPRKPKKPKVPKTPEEEEAMYLDGPVQNDDETRKAETQITDPLSGRVEVSDVTENGEPPNLAGLKRYWRNASKRDRKAFLLWIKE